MFNFQGILRKVFFIISQQLRLYIALSVLALTVTAIMIAGLNPQDFYFSNNVSWLAGGPGIKFGKYGVAYTDPFFEAGDIDGSEPDGFSLEICLAPQHKKGGAFSFIVTLHNGEDSDQLLLGQWRSHIIAMNGDDYDYTRGVQRISVDTLAMPAKAFFLTITTGAGGTRVYIDGQLIDEKRNLVLKIPDGNTMARLVIGNSVSGKNSWAGSIYGLVFYLGELSPQRVARHYRDWSQKMNFSFAKKAKPYALYLFDGPSDQRYLDRSGGGHHLIVPSRMKVLEKKFLDLPPRLGRAERGWLKDIILNLAGFMPLGFVLAAVLTRLKLNAGRHALLWAVICGCLLSLTIELIQAWMPSRDSSMVDLLSNTSGTMIGALFYKMFTRSNGGYSHYARN